MKTIITLALLGMFSAAIVGCEASGSISTDSNSPQHKVTDEKTVTDPNGNVISHTETKTQSDTTNH